MKVIKSMKDEPKPCEMLSLCLSLSLLLLLCVFHYIFHRFSLKHNLRIYWQQYVRTIVMDTTWIWSEIKKSRRYLLSVVMPHRYVQTFKWIVYRSKASNRCKERERMATTKKPKESSTQKWIERNKRDRKYGRECELNIGEREGVRKAHT